MNEGVKTIIYPVTDVAVANAVFGGLLGVEPDMDQPYYVGYSGPGGQHIGLDPNGHAREMTGPTPFWHVDDIAGTIDRLVAAGAAVRQAATDVGGGRLVATLTVGDGNPIGLIEDA